MLKQVMRTEEQSEGALSVYGKTGTGNAEGTTVDAWFTGFADTADKRIYFCIYLGQTEGADISSAKAKEIALKLLWDQYK